MSVLKVRWYIIDEDRIQRIGLDTKRIFPHLANKKAVQVWVFFRVVDNSKVIENIQIQWLYFDSDGNIDLSYSEKVAVSALDSYFSQERNDNVVSMRYKPLKVVLSDQQKKLLKSVIEKDFDPDSWESLPGWFIQNLWSKGIGVPFDGK